ncbi:MAG: histidine kinase [Opitutae bacterium]|nr:histidine kinase [Opitutae bacterium]
MPESANSPRPGPLSRIPLFWRLQLASWSGFSLLVLPLKQVFYGSLPGSLLVTAYQLPLALVCSTGLHWLFRRLRVEQQGFIRVAITVVAACLTATSADIMLSLLLNRLFGLEHQTGLPQSGLYAFRAAVYLIWCLGYFLIKSQLRNRELAFQAAVTEERHRLELLRYQLNPNFLAKSLATISHQIGINPATARAMTVRLGDFYQNTLRHTDREQTATIGDELALLRAYLEIEQLRAGPSALTLRYVVDDSLLPLPLPPVLLLPLAEKAAQTGGGRPGQPLEITVTVQRTDDGLILLEVSHSGRLDRSKPPFAVSNESGMAELRTSLDRYFAGKYRFNLSQDSFQVRATLCLPLTA